MRHCVLIVLLAFWGCDAVTPGGTVAPPTPRQSTAQMLTLSGGWVKTALHVHTYWSDGDDFAEVIIEKLAERGYDAAFVTDHSYAHIFDDHWRVLRPPHGEAALAGYRDRFPGLVITRDNSGETEVLMRKQSEYADAVSIPTYTGAETGAHDIHIGAVGIAERFPWPGPSQGWAEDINIVTRSTRSLGGVPVLNHHNYAIGGNKIPWTAIAESEINHYEVFNGLLAAGNEGPPSHTEQFLQINARRALEGRPALCPVAGDDAHQWHGDASSPPGRAWTTLRSASTSKAALLSVLSSCDLYASSGVDLVNFSANETRYTLRIAAEAGVTYRTKFFGLVDTSMVVLKKVRGTHPKYTLPLAKKPAVICPVVISNRVGQHGTTEKAWLPCWRLN